MIVGERSKIEMNCRIFCWTSGYHRDEEIDDECDQENTHKKHIFFHNFF